MGNIYNKSIKVPRLISILSAVLIPAVCYCIFCVTGNMYTFTDNVTVAVVTSGMYGDNNFCQYLHPFLCLIIKCLNPLLPTTDVFTALIHLFLLLGTGLLSYIAASTVLQKSIEKWRVEDFITSALLILAIINATLGMNLFGTNYTVQTAAIITSGTLVLFYGRNNENSTFWVISGTVLVCFGFLIRLEAALIFTPFFLLEIITGILRAEDKKDHLRRDLHTIAPCVGIILLILASRYIFNAIEPYSSAARYNKYRTVVEDYWMEGYDSYDKELMGIDESTYSVSRDWILVDTERVNADTLEQIANAGHESAYVKTLDGVKYAMKAMYKHSIRVDLHLTILTGLIVILLLWNLINACSIWLKLESLFAFVGASIILFYFTFMGRAPTRVWQCVFLATLTLLILIMIKSALDKGNTNKDERKANKIIRPVFLLFLCIILYFGVGQVMAVSSFHSFQTPFTSKIGADDSGYEASFEEDTLYIWPIWYRAVPEYFARQNKLPTQRVIDHNIAIGDWTYGQPYFNDFLERIDAKNPAIALLERPNTYLADGQTKELLWYMRDHYGEDIQLHYVGQANNRKVYQLIKSDKPLKGDENLEENVDSIDWDGLGDDELDNSDGIIDPDSE